MQTYWSALSLICKSAVYGLGREIGPCFPLISVHCIITHISEVVYNVYDNVTQICKIPMNNYIKVSKAYYNTQAQIYIYFPVYLL